MVQTLNCTKFSAIFHCNEEVGNCNNNSTWYSSLDLAVWTWGWSFYAPTQNYKVFLLPLCKEVEMPQATLLSILKRIHCGTSNVLMAWVGIIFKSWFLHPLYSESVDIFLVNIVFVSLCCQLIIFYIEIFSWLILVLDQFRNKGTGC